MLLEETLQKLTDMKLHAMARSIRDRLARPDHGDLPITDFIGFVVDDEWLDRQNRQLSTRLRQARFKLPAACLENLDYSVPRKLKKQQVLELAQNRWIEKHQNVVITGPAGSGKSYLAQALGNHLCRSGYATAYYRMPKLVIQFVQARADGSYLRLLNRLSKVPVLILDDLGVGKLTDDHRTDLLELIEDRYDQGSTIITAQLPPSGWHDYLGGGIVADGICDRILHNAHRIELKSDDSLRRLKNGLSEEGRPGK
jgi:DNA replication protein DnaC